MRYYGTLGPACANQGTLEALIDAGMTGIRLNLSHSRLAERLDWVELYRSAARAKGQAPDLLIDLQGPELRTGDLPPEGLPLTPGETVRLGQGGIPVPAALLPALCRGVRLSIDDGALLLEAEGPDEESVLCRVLRGGTLRSRKSINLPGLTPPRLPTLTEEDRQNLALAGRAGVTGVMLSYVRDEEDLLTLRACLEEAGCGQIRILAKIENRQGVDSLPRLLPCADEFVIARGDLGANLPLWEVPAIQKESAAILRSAGRPFMVVTQLLHSMHASPAPTRAEISDIFNAVLDGASSLMLTGETAVGKYPAEAMGYLVKTAQAALQWREAQR